MSDPDTRTKLLDVAMELIQTRGYNAFSFRDLAERLGIKTASIHYHFPTKGRLGLALVQRHRQVLAEVLGELETQERDPLKRLQRYAGVFRSTLENGGRMCLGGVLAIDYQTLPKEVVAEVWEFFEDNERWLARTLLTGKKAGTLAFSRPAGEMARTLFAALEGALLAARAFEDHQRFESAVAWLLASLKA